MAVRLVAQVADADDLAVLHQLRDLLDQRRLVNLVRQLGDDDLLAVATRHLYDPRLCAHDDATATVRVRLLDGVAHQVVPLALFVERRVAAHAVDQAGRREVRTFDDVGKLFRRRGCVFDEQGHGGADFADVVWRDVRRHADGDAG